MLKLILKKLAHVFKHIYDNIYRVSQEERSIFLEVIVSVILSKKVYTYMCAIPNGFRYRAISFYSSLDLAPNIFLPSRV
jgi:hypothetical protein